MFKDRSSKYHSGGDASSEKNWAYGRTSEKRGNCQIRVTREVTSFEFICVAVPEESIRKEGKLHRGETEGIRGRKGVVAL